MTPEGRRRLAALGGVAALIALAALVFGGGGKRPGHAAGQVPPGGSAFGTRTAGARAPGVDELTALAPILSQAGAAAGGPSAPGLGEAPARAAARLLLVGFAGTSPRVAFFGRLARRDWGGIVLDRSNVRGAAQLASLTRAAATTARHARSDPPLLIARAAGGPGGVTVPGTGGPRTEAAARTAARRLHASGIRAVLGPSADLADPGGPWASAGLADDAADVTRAATAVAGGWRSGGVVAIPGRFPGEGAASGDPGAGTATVGLGLSDLQGRDVKPFAALAPGVPAIQMSDALYAAWDGVTPATLLPAAIRLLRASGFRGAIVSGDLTAATLATGGSVADAALTALRAGCDLLYVPGDAGDQEAAYDAIVRGLRAGTLPIARVRDALAHAELLRHAAGLT